MPASPNRPDPKNRPAIIGAVVGLLFTAWLSPGCTRVITDNDIKAVTLTEVRAYTGGKDKKSVLVVDPRPADDFRAAHIPGAKNLDLASVQARGSTDLNPELAAFETIIVYGDDPGSPAAKAMVKRLLEKGHDDVYFYSGGLGEWARSGLRVDGEKPKAPDAAPPPGPAK
jgi:rhodanese-related sulfurtransferase